MSVSVTAGLLDLFAPKFGMDRLGVPGEKVTIRVSVESKDGKNRMIFFGTYLIGGRHAQITSKRLVDFSPEVNVISIERYSLKDFVVDANRVMAASPLKGRPELKWENGKVCLVVEGQVLSVTVEDIYVAAAKVFALLTCQGKSLRIALGDDVEVFDKSRRQLVGMKMKGEKLMLKRAFQNPEINQTGERRALPVS